MKHEVKEDGNRVVIRASLKPRRFARDPVEAINTEDILAILKLKGYNLDKYRVVKEGSCSNYKPESPISSEWILELIEEKKEEKVVNNSKQSTRVPRSRRTARKTKKDQLLRTEDMGRVQS